jgi:hypothetical protein
MDWEAAQERLRGPMFAPLRASLARLDPSRWPSHEALTALADGATGPRPRTYPAGTPGPIAATTLIERDGRAWHESATP